MADLELIVFGLTAIVIFLVIRAISTQEMLEGYIKDNARLNKSVDEMRGKLYEFFNNNSTKK